MTTQGPPPGAAGPGGAGAGQPQPSEEELQAALEDQMRRLSVADVLVQTAVTLVNLGARKLGMTGEPAEGDKPDLEQARLAIDGTRAILPLLPGDLGPIRDALSQLQVAYARAAGPATGAAAPAAPEGSPTEAPGPTGAPAAEPAEDPERAAARAKIWTPRGS